MPRVLISAMLSLGLLFAGALPAAAAGSKIAKAMGNLRWGMDEGQVIRLIQRQLKKQYGKKIRKEGDLRREEELREELREKTFAIRKSLVEFSGDKTNWDVSDVGGEYTHGNSESMLVAKDGEASTYYFFIDGHLWKWIKTFDSDVFGGNDFRRFKKTISKKFGKGRVKSGERNEKRGAQQWVEFIDRRSRMRAVDDTKFYGKYALVFEEMSTVKDLPSMRNNTVNRKKKTSGAVAGLSRRHDADSSNNSVVDKITGKDRRKAGKLKQKKRRSLFANDQAQESEDEYEKRRKKAEAAQQAKQRRAHRRKERRKAAKALDDVPLADDDDDPLSGL